MFRDQYHFLFIKKRPMCVITIYLCKHNLKLGQYRNNRYSVVRPWSI